MKPEQKMGTISFALGVAMGFFSYQVGGGPVAWLVPIAVYVGSVFGLKKVFTEKKPKWIVTNSILTFLLVWVVSWIFILNAVL